MGATVWPVNEDFVAEIGGVDLSEPLTAQDWATIDSAYATYSILIFPDQKLSQNQHVDFAQRFGEIDLSMVADMDMGEPRTPAEIADVSNLGSAGEVLDTNHRLMEFQRGNRLWHTDSSFKQIPANASLLYLQSVPPVGGQTQFADMRAAWDALEDTVRHQIEGRIALHSIATSRARMGFEMTPEENGRYPRVPQALVRTHRISGRKSIYVASHAGEIVGMNKAEAEELLNHLLAHGTQRQFVHTHRWRADDLVVWDNRCVLHRGRPFDDVRWPRDAQRATSTDIANTCVQEGIALPEELVPA